MRTEAYTNANHPMYEETNARVSSAFQEAYPGKVQQDATGRNIQPTAKKEYTAAQASAAQRGPVSVRDYFNAPQEERAAIAREANANRARKDAKQQAENKNATAKGLIDRITKTQTAQRKAIAKQDKARAALAARKKQNEEKAFAVTAKVEEEQGSIAADNMVDASHLFDGAEMQGSQTKQSDFAIEVEPGSGKFARLSPNSGLMIDKGVPRKAKIDTSKYSLFSSDKKRRDIAAAAKYQRNELSKDSTVGGNKVSKVTRSATSEKSGDVSVSGAPSALGAAINEAFGFDRNYAGYHKDKNGNWSKATYDGSSSSSSSSRVICTELVRQGLMAPSLQRLDVAFTVARLSPAHVRGYHVWAVPFVRLMRKHPLSAAMIEPLARWRAEEVAYQLGDRDKPNWLGKITRWIGEPICWVIGHFVGETETVGLYG